MPDLFDVGFLLEDIVTIPEGTEAVRIIPDAFKESAGGVFVSHFDASRFIPVPEPATRLMQAAAFLVLAAARRWDT